MTRAEWDAIMLRWMHRNDITGDLDDVWEYASNSFFNGWLKDDGRTILDTDDKLLAAAPECMLQLGLQYLHQLAQDDEGLQRQITLARQAMGDFVINFSIVNIPAQATRPYYDDEVI